MFEALVIVLREGVEAALVLAIVLGTASRAAARRTPRVVAAVARLAVGWALAMARTAAALEDPSQATTEFLGRRGKTNGFAPPSPRWRAAMPASEKRLNCLPIRVR